MQTFYKTQFKNLREEVLNTFKEKHNISEFKEWNNVNQDPFNPHYWVDGKILFKISDMVFDLDENIEPYIFQKFMNDNDITDNYVEYLYLNKTM